MDSHVYMRITSSTSYYKFMTSTLFIFLLGTVPKNSLRQRHRFSHFRTDHKVCVKRQGPAGRSYGQRDQWNVRQVSLGSDVMRDPGARDGTWKGTTGKGT
jgi:hypothetical protein